MNEARFKSIVYREIGSLMAALSEPRRLAILDLLAQRERNVETLAAMLGMGVTTVSHHLQVLKKARLVDERSEGRYRYYTASSTALELWESVSRVAARDLAEIRCAVAEVSETGGEPVSYDEAVRAAVAVAREQVAQLIGASPKEVVFISGGTESNNYAIFGTARELADRGRAVLLERRSDEHSLDLEPEPYLVVRVQPARHDVVAAVHEEDFARNVPGHARSEPDRGVAHVFGLYVAPHGRRRRVLGLGVAESCYRLSGERPNRACGDRVHPDSLRAELRSQISCGGLER